jgi:hypothetical protein
MKACDAPRVHAAQTKLEDEEIGDCAAFFSDWPYGINHLTHVRPSPPKMSNTISPATTA